MSWKDFRVPDEYLEVARRAEENNKYVISTPYKIACEMVELLPEELFIPETKFLNIFSKSGQILLALKNRLMESEAMIKRFPNERHRRNHIVWHQLYGLCITEKCADSTAFMLYKTAWNDYNNLVVCNNILSLVKEDKNKALEFIHKNFKEYNEYSFLGLKESEETGEIMKFDVVIGNPPYNNDMYIPFVELGHQLADKCSVFITPAKWQAKGGKLNEQFRENIVPYMSKIVYYPDDTELFDIHALGGISYYLMDKQLHNDKTITNHCKLQKIFNGESIRPLNNLLYNNAYSIISKIGTYGSNFLSNARSNNNHLYKVNISHLVNVSGTRVFSSTGDSNVLCPLYIESELAESNYFTIYSSDNINKCKSFRSYCDTRIIRFLVLVGLCSGSIKNDETWRFVPDPQDWTIIYEDKPLNNYEPDINGMYVDNNGNKHCSLYVKYKLTEDDINIIESVIKERK